jgi:hypothetical protein
MWVGMGMGEGVDADANRIDVLYPLESCGTVPNPEKSRLSRPAGQSGLVPKNFRDGTNGTGQTGRDRRDGTI